MIIRTGSKDLDSHGTEIDEESFQLGALPPEDSLEHSDSLHRVDEDLLMLKRSNFFRRFFTKLWKGPLEPSDERPTYPKKFRILRFIDDFPETFFRRYVSNPIVRSIICILYCLTWLGLMFELLKPYLLRQPYFYPDTGSGKVPIIPLTCDMMLDWEGTDNACGTNAELCEPFNNKEYFARCPALCDVDGWLYSAVAVGDQRNKYRGYQIGGGSKRKGDRDGFLSLPYRADSFPCSAAVHAGVISPVWGGCVNMLRQGSQNEFPSANGKFKTGLSIGFDSFFPASFSFKAFNGGVATGCYDPRVPLIVLNFFFGLPALYLTRGIVGYWIITIIGYWTITLALDPPVLANPHDPSSVAELLSVGFQRLLPLCFVLYVLWKCAVKRTLDNGSPLTKVLLWYPTFWSGIMNNVTYDRLPVDRLTFSDMKEQPGAATAVGFIVVVIAIAVIIQGYSIWKSGRLRKYLLLYLVIILLLLLLQSIPRLNLRLHHYILGMLLLPGCATRGASAYLFQGILIGLVISGVSRWDFASIIETNRHLLRNEAGALLAPPIFSYNPNNPHSISWVLRDPTANSSNTGFREVDEKIDGFSLLMNDFQIYVGKNTTVDIKKLLSQNDYLSSILNETRDVAMNLTSGEKIRLYFRVARASIKNPIDVRGDYTNAAVLEWPDGRWSDPAPGVS